MTDPEPKSRAPADPDDAVAEALARIETLRRQHAAERSARPASGIGEATPPPPGEDDVRAVRELERVREARQWRGRDLSIAGLVAKTRREADAVRRRLGSIVGVWHTLVPPEIAAHVELTAIRGGIVHVTADSSAVAFELDRRLREGLLTELRRAYRGTLSRVKVTVGTVTR